MTLVRREKCLRNRSEKGHLPALRCPPEAKPAPPGVAGNTVDPCTFPWCAHFFSASSLRSSST